LQYSEILLKAYAKYRGAIGSDQRDLKDPFVGDYLEMV